MSRPFVIALCFVVACDGAAPSGEATGAGGASASDTASSGAPAQGGAAAGTGGAGAGGAPIDEGLDLGGGVTVWPSVLEPGASATIVYRGELAGEVTLHYGFDGWSQTSGARTPQDDGTGNLDYYLEQPMAPLADEPGFTTTIALEHDARALHFVFRSGSEWDNHDGKDYGTGVPFPYLGPYLTWDGTTGPDDGVIVSFATGHVCTASVAYGETTALGASASEASPVSGVHHVRLEGLPADTTIHYRIGCDALEGEIHSFRTAPADPQAFRFLVLGDMQDDGENGRWGDVAAAIVSEHDDAAFLVVTGDMTWNDRPGLWWTFFDRGRELFASKVMMPAAGNHDTPGVDSSPDTSSFEGLFPTPPASGSPTYYRYDYGSARLFALDSEKPGDFASGAAQEAWLAQALSGAQPEWVFAYWHVPPYNAGKRHWSQQGDFRDATASFDGKLDWFFGGHEHLYQRHAPLRYNGLLAPSGSYGRGASDGVGYLIVPPAGVWPETELIPHDDPKAYYRDRLAYPLVAPPADVAPSEIGFVEVAIDGKTIAITSYGLGTLAAPLAEHAVDSVSYTKP